MLISIDDKDYELIITENSEIRIVHEPQKKPSLYAHPLHTLDELKAFVRQFSKNPNYKSLEKIEELEFIKITIFGKDYPVKILRKGIQRPYLKEGIIYYSTTATTNIHQEIFKVKIYQELFEHYILSRISYWEEELDILSNEITFRKLKSSNYRVNKNKKNITFNKSNAELSIRINDYIALQSLLNLSEKRYNSAKLIQKHFQDHEQILNYLKYGK